MRRKFSYEDKGGNNSGGIKGAVLALHSFAALHSYVLQAIYLGQYSTKVYYSKCFISAEKLRASCLEDELTLFKNINEKFFCLRCTTRSRRSDGKITSSVSLSIRKMFPLGSIEVAKFLNGIIIAYWLMKLTYVQLVHE
jgi:hypothetical protein